MSREWRTSNGEPSLPINERAIRDKVRIASRIAEVQRLELAARAALCAANNARNDLIARESRFEREYGFTIKDDSQVSYPERNHVGTQVNSKTKRTRKAPAVSPGDMKNDLAELQALLKEMS